MELKRKAWLALEAWKSSPERKPLILQGPRQTGKTWLLKHFGSRSFDDNAYFNFERQPQLKQLFVNDKDPNRLLELLSLVHGKQIRPGRTLVVFDEIQECSDALNALKYFHEEMPDLAIACAGSLLGVALSRGISFPVGKVDFLQIYPLSFSEFLAAADPLLYNYFESVSVIEPIPDIFFNQLADKLKMYFVTGGMPEAVVAVLAKRDMKLVQNVLQNILSAYMLDFSKYIDNHNIPKIHHIWNSLPSQLARENKKFLYQAIKSGARAREYEDSLLWLIQAGLVHRIFCCEKPALPLSAYDDISSFKIYLADIGLLRRLSLLDPIALTEGNRLFTEFKGALTENYVLTTLLQQFEGLPRYWRSGNMAEVDFVVALHNDVIPVEVKADENVKSRSLAIYRKTFQPELAIRYSLRNLSYHDGLLNIPLFLADRTLDLINIARNNQG